MSKGVVGMYVYMCVHPLGKKCWREEVDMKVGSKHISGDHFQSTGPGEVATVALLLPLTRE